MSSFREVEPKIAEEYGQAVEGLRRAKIADGVAVPSLQETTDILGRDLTSVQIAEVLKMKQSSFRLEPQKPVAAYLRGIDLNLRRGQVPTFISHDVEERFAAIPSSDGIRIGFVEGGSGHEMDSDPALARKELRKQEKMLRSGHLPKGVRMISPRSYCLMQLDAMETADFADDVTDSFSYPLDYGSRDPNFTVAGFWLHNQLHFDQPDPDYVHRNIRWRRSVMVDVKR